MKTDITRGDEELKHLVGTLKGRMRELLDNPRTGLKDSSDTNKTRMELLGMVDEIVDTVFPIHIAAAKAEERSVLLSDKKARIAEYPDEGVMFVLKYEDGQLYEASMPIPKWHKTGNVEFRKSLTQ